ncbi:hypothetical protein OMCYN_01637 [cyanobiont of Ornithocercus magnificus]|nr:hypothetical protein OMCYN_01637 [cyanobiont of Ornithocercus magnificus]
MPILKMFFPKLPTLKRYIHALVFSKHRLAGLAVLFPYLRHLPLEFANL